MTGNLPAEVRARRVLRERHHRFLTQAGVLARDPDAIECEHPARGLTYDGLWTIESPPLAAVTCGACGTSLTLPIREDVAAELSAQAASDGGPRANDGHPESDDSRRRVMPITLPKG